ncbi:MAG TPA: cysteine dioxygenase family protein [Candidatus Cybelea sp.]
MFRRLIEDLRARSPLERDSSEIGALLAACRDDWPSVQPLPSRPGAYTRTCVYRDARFEVLLLNWAPGAASAIHDHGDQHCWMLVLDGQLEVEDYVRLDPGDVPGYAHVERRGSRTLDAGGMDLRSGRFDLHRVSATNWWPAVSLHVYCGPMRKFLIYDEYARRCEIALGTYDKILSVNSEPALR